MNALEQTTQLAIELIKQQKVTDYEFSVGKSSGVSTSVRLSEVETLKYHLEQNEKASLLPIRCLKLNPAPDCVSESVSGMNSP